MPDEYKYVIFFLAAVATLFLPPLSAGEEVAGTPLEQLRDSDYRAGQGFDECDFREQVCQYLGIPYRLGGSSRKGMDCSGFAKHIYSKLFGVDLPHNSYAQYKVSFLKSIPKEELRSGDLVFFARGKRIEHVGIYLSEGRFIHAASRKGVIISNLDTRYWRSRFAGSKRLGVFDEDKDATVGTEGLVEVSLNEWNQIELGFAGIVPGNGESATSQGSIATPPILCSSPVGSDMESFFSLELGYNRALLSDVWNLRVSALLERSSSGLDEAGFRQEAIQPSPASDGSAANHFYRSGLKIASSLDLFGGLRITPSVTYIGYDGRSEVDTVAKRILGLEALMILPVNDFRMSMSLNHVHFQDPLFQTLGTQETPGSINMSYALQYDVMRSLLHVSLLGRHSLNGSSDYPSISSAKAKSYYDMFFKFDFTY